LNQRDTSPTKKNLRVLNLEDNQHDSELIRAVLETEWPEIELLRVESQEAFVGALEKFKPDVVLSDYQKSGADFDGGTALHLVRQFHPEIPVIIVSSTLDEVVAVDLLKMGARDFVRKDHLTRLISSIQTALALEQGIRTRKAMEKALRESEARYQAIISSVNDAIVCIKPGGIIYLWNRKAEELFGYPAAEAIGQNLCQLIIPEHLCKQVEEELPQLAQPGVTPIAGATRQLTAKRKDNSELPIELSVSSMNIQGEWHATSIISDITERKRAETRIQRLNHLYESLSHCNQTIVRSTNQTELFVQICRNAVQFGGFKMVWIGLIDPATRMIVPAASSGEGAEEYLRNLKISVDEDSVYGQGPTGKSIREAQPFWCQDFLSCNYTTPWHDRAVVLGWRSSASLPIRRDGEIVGAIMLYSGELNAFDEETRSLLTEMNEDVNFALDNFSHEAKRKLTEKSLADSRNLLKTVIDTAPVRIFWKDKGLRYLGSNPAFARDAGVAKAEDLIGKDDFQLAWKEQAERFRADDQQVMDTGVPKLAYDEQQHTPEGHVIWVRTSKVPLRNEANEAMGVLGMYEDVTESKQAEIKLKLFRALLDNSDDAIEVLEPGSLRFIDVNDAGCREWGYSRDELLSMSIPDVDPAVDLEARRKLEAQIRQAGRVRFETMRRRKDGGMFPVEVSSTWVELDKPYVLGIVRNITERKQAEAKMAEQYKYVEGINAKLRETNKQLEQAQSQLLQSEKMSAIGLLASGVAHEINNPVGYVNSNLGTLEKYLADIFVILDKYEAVETLLGGHPLLEELRQFKAKVDFAYIRNDTKSLIAESHEGLERVKKIILDLKEFAHFDNEDRWVWADVHQGLNSTLNVVWNELKYKCEVVKEYGDLPKIYCLPSQLNQVFMNLLVNAAQAIEVRGKITLRTGQEGDWVWVKVSDTGKGIRAEDMPNLFNPFFTTKPVGEGTGLGLSVSYRIMEKHHGRIEVQSEIGKGTTFVVWLPVQQPNSKETT